MASARIGETIKIKYTLPSDCDLDGFDLCYKQDGEIVLDRNKIEYVRKEGAVITDFFTEDESLLFKPGLVQCQICVKIGNEIYKSSIMFFQFAGVLKEGKMQ